jgi:hypothetical protein
MPEVAHILPEEDDPEAPRLRTLVHPDWGLTGGAPVVA